MPAKVAIKEIEEEPPAPSVGAVIKPRASVKPGPHNYFFDVDDEGIATITIQRKRQRKTGRTVKDLDGKDVDEYEGYTTPHTIKVTPGPTPTGVEDTPASMRLVKMLKRKRLIRDDKGEMLVRNKESGNEYYILDENFDAETHERQTEEVEVPYERPVRHLGSIQQELSNLGGAA